VKQHLKHLPEYLVGTTFASKTPVQTAICSQLPGRGSGAAFGKKRRDANYNDPLRVAEGSVGEMQSSRRRVNKAASGRAKVTYEDLLAKSNRMERAGEVDVERLPGLSGRKIWKMNHGKKTRKTVDKHHFTHGRKALAARRRSKKFPGLSS